MKRPVRRKLLRLKPNDKDGRKELLRLTRLEIVKQKNAGGLVWKIRADQALLIMKQQLRWLNQDLEHWDDGKLHDLNNWLRQPAEKQKKDQVFVKLEVWLLMKKLLHWSDVRFYPPGQAGHMFASTYAFVVWYCLLLLFLLFSFVTGCPGPGLPTSLVAAAMKVQLVWVVALLVGGLVGWAMSCLVVCLVGWSVG